jgi:tRNA pseudouridine38/39 synthase
VAQEFNARYQCTKRRYKYFFAKNNLNIDLMKKVIKDYEGTHNFINFCKINVTNTVNFERTIFSADIIKVNSDEKLEEGDDRN